MMLPFAACVLHAALVGPLPEGSAQQDRVRAEFRDRRVHLTSDVGLDHALVRSSTTQRNVNDAGRAVNLELTDADVHVVAATTRGIDVVSTWATVHRTGPARSDVATRKLGLPCEIRPLMDPTAVTPGHDVLFRLHLPGEETSVTVVHDGVEPMIRREAMLIVHIDRAGVWTITGTSMVGEVEYRATLEFEVGSVVDERDREVTP